MITEIHDKRDNIWRQREPQTLALPPSKLMCCALGK